MTLRSSCQQAHAHFFWSVQAVDVTRDLGCSANVNAAGDVELNNLSAQLDQRNMS